MQATSAELELINKRLPEGASVQARHVEILPFMMFDSKETDRSTIMSDEMMRKLVYDLDMGKVAMNAMHLSHSTLPAGRSVSGKFVSANGTKQVLAKMYVVVQRPDGSPLGDGKDLADRYNTGAVFACSAGVYVGFYKCSICGNDIRDYQHCDHWPGEVYQIDEKPVKCTALMTGHDIQDGMAMDCGAYELSAVTAGGVRDAGILTETFGKFQEGVDMQDLKKSTFESKTIVQQVAFFPVVDETNKPEEFAMSLTADDVKKLVKEEYGPVILENTSLKLELDQFKVKVASLEATIEQFGAKEVALTDATAKITEFTTEVETLKKAVVDMTVFRTALADIVAAEATKVAKTYTAADQTVEQMLEAYEGFKAEVALLPSGEQSASSTQTVVEDYVGLPDSCFKVS